VLKARILVRTQCGHWAISGAIEGCIRKIRSNGARGVLNAHITALVGPPELLKEVSVTQYGDIERPQGVESVEIGTARISIRKPKS
jgi:hypothetical protein